MGQPSFQASNAIIYLTYGAFLFDFTIQNDRPLSLMRSTQDFRSIHCLAVQASVQVGISGEQPDAEGSATKCPSIKEEQPFGCVMMFPFPQLRKQRTDMVLAFPLALNFIASGECVGALRLLFAAAAMTRAALNATPTRWHESILDCGHC